MVQVEALADSKASASIISLYLAKKVNMIIFEKGDATLNDTSNKHMDVSGRGETMIQEEFRIPHKIRMLISRDLGQDKLVVGLEDLKELGILHHEFHRTLPEIRREDAVQQHKRRPTVRANGGERAKKQEGKSKRRSALPGGNV